MLISHVPMAGHADGKEGRVVGGGDCGAGHELIQYDAVGQSGVVEPEPLLVEVCRK